MTTQETTTIEEIHKLIQSIKQHIASLVERKDHFEKEQSKCCHQINGLEWALQELEARFK